MIYKNEGYAIHPGVYFLKCVARRLQRKIKFEECKGEHILAYQQLEVDFLAKLRTEKKTVFIIQETLD